MRTSRALALKKTLVVGAIGISVLGLTAQPVFAADNVFQKIQQSISGQFEKLYLQLIPGDKPGKMVLKQVGIASQSLKSFDGQTTFEAEAVGGGKTIAAGKITTNGPTVIGQVWDTSSYKQDLAIKAELSYQDKGYEALADIRMVDGVTYLQLTKLPDSLGTKFDTSLNTWVKFEPMTASAGATPAPTASKWTPDQQAKLQDAFYKMLNASDVSPAKVENKDGVNVYVLTATLSKPALAEYITTVRQVEMDMMKSDPNDEMQDVMNGKMSNEDDSLAMMMKPATPEEVKANTEKMLANVGDIKATFWIDKSSFYPRHFELPFIIDAKNMAAETPAAAQLPKTVPVNKVEQVKAMIIGDFSKHNQSFDITAPADAQDSRVFFTKIMGTFMPGMAGMMTPTATTLPVMPPGMRPPTVGTTELPAMTAEQKKALDQYEKMMHTTLPVPH